MRWNSSQNQIRSGVSSRPIIDDKNEDLSNLASEIRTSVLEVGVSSESERKIVLMRVQKAIRKMSEEINNSSIMKET